MAITDLRKLKDSELLSRKKTLVRIQIFIAIIMVVYLIVFILQLINETWMANEPLGVSFPGILVIIIAIITSQISFINIELKKRTNT